ncbi:uncharacterized protein LOC132545190 [Ylistrum balloti]|uniref:uncharacterized protein LOC132545190 n=1 Tax=Ylistrum balloti TaxID=509963 RepID=UPI002905D4CA|nr:uncharacterized protein LOC132545190 [Ylistrum balloti]
MTNVLVVLFALTVVTYAALGTPTPDPFQCKEHNDCSATQCCSKIPRYFVVSKKRQLSPPISMYVSASCQPYLQVNESCYNVMKANGDCGCAPELICKYFPELDTFNHIFQMPLPELLSTVAPSKRLAIPASPEAYKCVSKSHQ